MKSVKNTKLIRKLCIRDKWIKVDYGRILEQKEGLRDFQVIHLCIITVVILILDRSYYFRARQTCMSEPPYWVMLNNRLISYWRRSVVACFRVLSSASFRQYFMSNFYADVKIWLIRILENIKWEEKLIESELLRNFLRSDCLKLTSQIKISMQFRLKKVTQGGTTAEKTDPITVCEGQYSGCDRETTSGLWKLTEMCWILALMLYSSLTKIMWFSQAKPRFPRLHHGNNMLTLHNYYKE